MNQVESTLASSAVHDQWESIFRTEENERCWEMMFDWFAPILPRGRTLDAGCGIGQHAIRLRRRGFAVAAVDFSPDRVAAARDNIARQGLDIPVSRGVVTRLRFAERSFDAVLCWGVLMHVPDVGGAIAELCRVAKPGGRIAIYENSVRSINSWILGCGVAVKRLLGRAGTRRIDRTRFGLESWTETEVGPLLIRRSFLGALKREFAMHGCH